MHYVSDVTDVASVDPSLCIWSAIDGEIRCLSNGQITIGGHVAHHGDVLKQTGPGLRDVTREHVAADVWQRALALFTAVDAHNNRWQDMAREAQYRREDEYEAALARLAANSRGTVFDTTTW